MPVPPAAKRTSVCPQSWHAQGGGEDIQIIFNAPDRKTAEVYLKKVVDKYAVLAPKLADWMEVNIPEGLTVFAFPRAHQRRLRTFNYLERLSQEIKRRTRIVRVFPNEDSCLRLVSAILMEFNEEWEFGRIYLSMEDS